MQAARPRVAQDPGDRCSTRTAGGFRDLFRSCSRIAALAQLPSGPVMTAYRIGWQLLTGLAATGGLVVASFALPTGGLLVLLLIGAGLGAALHPYPIRWLRRSAHTAPSVWSSAAGHAVGLVAVAGLSVLVGTARTAALLGSWAAASIPLWHDRPPRRRGTPAARPPVARDDGQRGRFALELPLPDVRSWPTDSVCWAWRWSFSELQLARSSETLMRVADERRVYLDELQRRDPVAFAVWMACDPRAAGDPLPLLPAESDTDGDPDAP